MWEDDLWGAGRVTFQIAADYSIDCSVEVMVLRVQ
jgi:hypothetical protein